MSDVVTRSRSLPGSGAQLTQCLGRSLARTLTVVAAIFALLAPAIPAMAQAGDPPPPERDTQSPIGVSLTGGSCTTSATDLAIGEGDWLFIALAAFGTPDSGDSRRMAEIDGMKYKAGGVSWCEAGVGSHLTAGT